MLILLSRNIRFTGGGVNIEIRATAHNLTGRWERAINVRDKEGVPMPTRGKISGEIYRLFPVWVVFASIAGCVAAAPPTQPPENYKGPVAEAPTVQPADYWAYELADGRRTWSRPDDLLKSSNVGFPLWVGKQWSYESQSTRVQGQSLTERAPIRENIQCEVISFNKITVTAGTFEAFECKCQCALIAATGVYDLFCGEWILWYAPAAKNIVRIKTESTESSMQLAQYKVSPPPVPAKIVDRPGFKAEKPEWKVGYEWRFAWTRPGSSGTMTSEVIREDTFEGVPSYVVRSGKDEIFFTKDSLGVLANSSGGRLISKRNVPHQYFSWPLAVGNEWRSVYVSENLPEKSSQNYDFRKTVPSIEEVQVPAGTFEAFKIETHLGYSDSLSEERWYSSQVKYFVKIRRYDQDGIREWELMSYKTD